MSRGRRRKFSGERVNCLFEFFEGFVLERKLHGGCKIYCEDKFCFIASVTLS